ncbi:MAG: P-II family nitrogen regulator [Polyangiaceae bacterium]
MLDKVHAKLITIIASSELQDRIEADLRRLGAPGYTLFAVDGHGKHRTRKRGLLESGNVRFEAVVSSQVAETLLEYVEREAQSAHLLAFSHDVDAVPRSRFA